MFYLLHCSGQNICKVKNYTFLSIGQLMGPSLNLVIYMKAQIEPSPTHPQLSNRYSPLGAQCSEGSAPSPQTPSKQKATALKSFIRDSALKILYCGTCNVSRQRPPLCQGLECRCFLFIYMKGHKASSFGFLIYLFAVIYITPIYIVLYSNYTLFPSGPNGVCILRSLSHMGKFNQEPINLHVGFWSVGRKQSTQRKPTQT